MEASITLGVPEMDDDHATLEALLAAVPRAPDRQVPALFREIAGEISAHFAREEALMRRHRLPVLFCHIAQHKRITDTIRDAEFMLDLLDIPALRHFLQTTLPGQLEAHMASMDRLSAGFIRGDVPAEAMADLRMPMG